GGEAVGGAGGGRQRALQARLFYHLAGFLPAHRMADLDAAAADLDTAPDPGAAGLAAAGPLLRRLAHRGAVLGGDGEVGGLGAATRSEEHTSELQSRENLVCRLLLEKKECQLHEPAA